VSFALTDEQNLIRRTAAEFIDREVVPHRARWDRDELVDRSIIGRLGELGILGLTIPEEYGGTPCDHRAYVLVMEELGRGDSAIRGIVSVSLGLVGKSIYTYGNDGQRKELLPGLCSGELLACFGLTEPDSGSDAGSLRARAVRDGDDWVLSGEKVFITNGTWADVALVFARTGGPGPKGITAFLVPTDSPGFEAREIKGKLGLRGQATASLHLDGVRVPDAARLGELGQGFRIAMGALGKGRMSVAAGCVGIARGALEAATAYARQREQFGKPIASFQLIQELLADTAVDVDAGRYLCWAAAELVDRGEPVDLAASKAKLFCSEAAVRAANNALQVFGGYGYVDEYPVGKYTRDARVMTLYEGTSQVQKLIIGRALTGVSAFG
jgi:alkylation response protein AidB-like acyl-CoA dehydrogenase